MTSTPRPAVTLLNSAASATTGYGAAFLQKVKAASEASRVERASQAAGAPFDPRARLKQHITTWWANLPPDARQPHYHMETLANLLVAPPQQLGLALRELSWTCKRKWQKSGQPYRNFWTPPPDVPEFASPATSAPMRLEHT